MRLLYLHGIGSGANSRTPRILREVFPEAEVLSPELPVSPKKAVEFLRNLYMKEDFDLIIGTSLGGFYAQTLWFEKKLLVNPAMYADEDIAEQIGLGVHPFFSERSDGAKEYLIDDDFIRELRDIREMIYSHHDHFYPEKMDINELNCTFAAFAGNDELLQHYEDFCTHYLPENAYRFEGGHRLSEENIREFLVPLIREILVKPEPPMWFTADEEWLRKDDEKDDTGI